jgi:hypothetical protein
VFLPLGRGDDAPRGVVPEYLTEPVSLHLCCIVLEGEGGQQVSGSIYYQRPSTFLEFDVLDADG